MPRGRPKASPHIRFRDEIEIWHAAQDRILNGGRLEIHCKTDGHAIAYCHKLNACRASLRELETNLYHIWDEYAVNRKDNVVIISLKQSILDRVIIKTEDGTIVPRQEIEKSSWRHEQEKEEMNRRITNRQYVATTPKLDGQGRPIRGNEDVPDPTKSLIDC